MMPLPLDSLQKARLEGLCRHVAKGLSQSLPGGTCFGLIFYELNTNWATSIGNGDREHLIAAFRKMADALETQDQQPVPPDQIN